MVSHWYDEILFHTPSYECLEDNDIYWWSIEQ